MAENVPTIESLVEQAGAVFKKEFDKEYSVAACAPGRVNLIGEHTDYNDGFVLPMALPLVTVIVGCKIDGDESVMVTTNPDADDPKRVVIDMPSKQAFVSVHKPGKPKWANYVKGVIAHYIGKVPTFQAVVVTSVPVGAGLSSSASLEVAAYTFFDALNGNPTDGVMPTDKALACQRAEHEYAGMPCGIMDQFISMMGKQDHALFIDCRLLTSKLIPINDLNLVILITNSNVKHELTGSEYSTRRKECETAAQLMRKESLRDASIDDLISLMKVTNEDTVIRRARHVICEIQRTWEAAKRSTTPEKFGKLMHESHLSLQNDFEVSCSELDQLVGIATETDGVLGSRMTGGGFGGCTVTLVYADKVDRLIERIKENYDGTPTFYICKPSDGARILKM